jgi:hypothetical protein
MLHAFVGPCPFPSPAEEDVDAPVVVVHGQMPDGSDHQMPVVVVV